jgi:DNA-binding SARP family transcriptional activator
MDRVKPKAVGGVQMEFLVLGTLDVSCRERPIRLTRPKSRALLALLLARPNRGVSTEQLIDELWAGAPPASADTAFRVHLAHLRGALGRAPGPIENTVNGYRIDLDETTFDALRFETALERARVATRGGAPEDAAALLAGCLTTFRGPAFAGAPDLEPVRAEALRLDDLRLTAVELLAGADLALGRADEACDLLGPVVAEHPLRESLTEKLMVALYRSGRQTEALRAFGRLDDALDRQLGVPPGPAVRALEHAIVVQAPELDGPRTAAGLAARSRTDRVSHETATCVARDEHASDSGMPQIESMLLANHAEAHDGLLYLMGAGFSDVRQVVPPGQAPPPFHFGIGLSVLVGWNETNVRHHIAVTLEPEDGGAPLLTAEADLEVGRPPGSVEGVDQRAVLAMTGEVQFPVAGGYRLLAVLGNQRRAASFRVHHEVPPTV